MPFEPQRRAYLVEKFGEEKVAELEAGSAATGKALIDADVAFKELQAVQVAAPVVVDVAAQFAAVLAPLTKALEDANAHAAAQDAQIAELLSQVKALKVGEDERIAEVFRPRALPFSQGVSATTAAQTIIDEKAAGDLMPEARYSWLKEIGPLA